MDKIKPHILFVTDAPPGESGSMDFYTFYIQLLMQDISQYTDISLYYTVIDDNKHHYDLHQLDSDSVHTYYSYIPSRFDHFEESFSNAQLDEVFKKIIQNHSFQAVHFFSLKNHSFNYPFISRENGIPTVMSINDHFMLCPLLFNTACCDTPRTCADCIKLSNFITSPLSRIGRKIASFIKPRQTYNWFEQIGRYSSYYNKHNMGSPSTDILKKRELLKDELVSFVDTFHFFSEISYNRLYRTFIPEHKTLFFEQGIEQAVTSDSRPFEIRGQVSFGFIGNIIPEEGIEELIDAFTLLKREGYDNKLHIFGDIVKNREYFERVISKKAVNNNIIFHGSVDPERITSILHYFDVLIMPSHWQRCDTFILNQAVALRKAVITNAKTVIGEKVRKGGRGTILEEVNPKTIAQAVISLETNRKKLYYNMRHSIDFSITTIEQNVQDLLPLYLSFRKKSHEEESRVSHKRFFKKKLDRQRSTS